MEPMKATNDADCQSWRSNKLPITGKLFVPITERLFVPITGRPFRGYYREAFRAPTTSVPKRYIPIHRKELIEYMSVGWGTLTDRVNDVHQPYSFHVLSKSCIAGCYMKQSQIVPDVTPVATYRHSFVCMASERDSVLSPLCKNACQPQNIRRMVSLSPSRQRRALTRRVVNWYHFPTIGN